MSDQDNDFSNRMKFFIENAIMVGRFYQSSQTGYLHYYHGMPIPATHQTIPIYENVLFVLALLRSRLIENIHEAKQLLQNILAFQSQVSGETQGNFPIYLHQYPICHHSETGISLIAPFYWILKNFGHVLGQELKFDLENSLSRLIDYGRTVHQKNPLPYSIAVRLAAGLMAVGKLLNRQVWQEEGIDLWKQLARPSISWYATAYLSDLLISHQMVVGQEIKDWELFWNYLQQTWNSQLCCYTGPHVREWQNKDEPLNYFYNLIMKCWFSLEFPRFKSHEIIHLEAVLIHSPFSEDLKSIQNDFFYQLDGVYKDQKWLLNKAYERTWVALEKKASAGLMGEKTFTPFCFFTGQNFLHTFVCQGGRFSQLEFKVLSSHSLEFLFHFNDVGDKEDRDKTRDICFYWNDHANWQVRVNNQQSNTFELGQTIQWSCQSRPAFTMVFELLEGKGQFLGHLAKGNRPSQFKLISEEKHCQVYDRILFIRTIRRTGPSTLRAVLHFSQS
ncbi:Uncharacterized protein PRO82_001839 [Candidatus Protochlamydia amoebophila]|uniref:hypothetical protein n=1 Tax=Candidatus Protochlamydia amoebophila TaxID=362787 RepID=UPI001BCA3979|nr:hypothetical protein [Candidatus Protochlamydia amoebophila]MBS4164510.1 Uncharacterized protein [Candidatus Protochlamydia amoebophila]